jgi:hypothetical protein
MVSPYIMFWQAFFSMNVLLWFGFFFYRDWTIRKLERDKIIEQGRIDYIDDRNIIQLDCPCGKAAITKEFFVNDLDDSNNYTCGSCHSTYKVEVTVDPILITTPVHVDASIQVFDALKKAGVEHAKGTAITL